MSGAKPEKDSDEKRFNETLRRMLKTPPKPLPKASDTMKPLRPKAIHDEKPTKRGG